MHLERSCSPEIMFWSPSVLQFDHRRTGPYIYLINAHQPLSCHICRYTSSKHIYRFWSGAPQPRSYSGSCFFHFTAGPAPVRQPPWSRRSRNSLNELPSICTHCRVHQRFGKWKNIGERASFWLQLMKLSLAPLALMNFVLNSFAEKNSSITPPWLKSMFNYLKTI